MISKLNELIKKASEESKLKDPGIPKKDGSGEGERKNKGRGGCDLPQQQKQGRGYNRNVRKVK